MKNEEKRELLEKFANVWNEETNDVNRLPIQDSDIDDFLATLPEEKEEKNLIIQLDKWIMDCKERAYDYGLNKNESLEITSIAMSVAYENVKEFINPSK